MAVTPKFDPDEPSLNGDEAHIATRAAQEGIPVAAIARVLSRSYAMVHNALRRALSAGSIGGIPKSDWLPAQAWDARAPVPMAVTVENISFACRLLFKLTPLEVEFLLALLKHVHVDKEKLHGVIENQRSTRVFRPDNQEATDPKMVDVMICKLRKKLRDVDDTLVIKTSWGKGYYIESAVKATVYKMAGATGGNTTHAVGPDPERAVAAAAPAG